VVGLKNPLHRPPKVVCFTAADGPLFFPPEDNPKTIPTGNKAMSKSMDNRVKKRRMVELIVNILRENEQLSLKEVQERLRAKHIMLSEIQTYHYVKSVEILLYREQVSGPIAAANMFKQWR
jgi:hypothetical protein